MYIYIYTQYIYIYICIYVYKHNTLILIILHTSRLAFLVVSPTALCRMKLREGLPGLEQLKLGGVLQTLVGP